jgi:hypothetical protein
MDAETKHYFDECARLGALARERKAEADALRAALTTLLAAIRYVDGMGLVNPRYAEAAERALRGL